MSIGRIGMIVLMVSLGGCAAAVGSGYGQGGRDSDGRTYADARADNALTARVNTELVRDGSVPAMAITVTTRNRVVTLEGAVASRAVAYRAERLAGSVSGVSAVVNRLRVNP